MVSTVPARAPLGASTTNRKWFLDVQDPDAPGVWVGVFGIQESKPRPSEATTQDDSDMDGEGHKSQTVTALASGFDGKVLRKLTASDATAYDPGQEIIRKVARRIGGVLRFRFYEMEPDGPRVEAYEGNGSPTWTPDGGNMESLDTAAFTITARGKLGEIAHPEGVTATPVVTAAYPDDAEEGDTLVIVGAYFTDVTGAAGVTIGGTNATSYEVDADGLIRAVVPAGAAGSAPIIVDGSTPFPYTRGA